MKKVIAVLKLIRKILKFIINGFEINNENKPKN